MSLDGRDYSPWTIPRTRPISIDLGAGASQHQKKPGIYKTSSGTFMYLTTSFSAALENLTYYPPVSKPELTPEQKATIRQTVVRELTPLRTFRKAHSHEIVINPTSPTKPPPRAPSVDFNMTYVLPNSTAVCPSLPVDINPLSPPAWGPIHRAPSHRTSQDSVRSSEIPEDSPGIVWAEQRQPRRASQDSMRSSFGAERAEHAGATAWTPFAQNTTRLSQDTSSNSGDSETDTSVRGVALQRLSHDGSAPRRTSTDSPRDSWRVSHDGIYPNMLGQPPAASAVSHGARSRGYSGDVARPFAAASQKPVTSAWSQTVQQNLGKPADSRQSALTRQQEIANAAASSFFAPTAPRPQRPSQDFPSKSGVLGGSPNTDPSATLSTVAAPAQRRSSQQAQHGQHARAPTPGGTASSAFFENSHGQDTAQQLPHTRWTAGKPSLHPQQVQAQASANLLRYQQSNAAETFQSQNAQFNYPQSYVQQLASSLQRPQHMGFPHNSGQSQYGRQTYPLSRISCDYPQAMSRHRASADFAPGQHPSDAQLHKANSLDIALSRQSLAAAREFAALDEATKRQAAAAAVQGGNCLPDSPWPGQSSSTHPAAAWPAQHGMQQHGLSPQALQLHALNTLNAMTGVPQQTAAQQSQRRSSQNPLHSVSALSELGSGAFQFSSIQQTLPHKSHLDMWPSASLRSSVDMNSVPFGGSTHLSRHSTSELGAKTSEVQGAWGSHLDAGDSPSSRRISSASRKNQSNPFLQPDSAFSIREAKQLLHHPKPIPKGVIPRVDTFASTLHDAWGAHAEHNTPAADENLDSRPPRLSSESVRSNASHKSQTSSNVSRPKSICRQGSGRAHHGYGYDPESDGWKVDCSTPTQRSFSTYTMAKPEIASSKGIIATAKELLAETANTAGKSDPFTRGTSQDGACGVKPLLGLLHQPSTPLPKKRRVLETLTFLAANPSIAYSICDHDGIALLLQVVASPADDLQLEAAEALQALLLHHCAQAAFDETAGLQKLAPSICTDQDAITQLTALHVLASVVYNPLRNQPVLSGQLQAAGLYDAVLALLLMHSQQEEESGRASDKGCLDWLEASHVGSPMAPVQHNSSVPDDFPFTTKPQIDLHQTVVNVSGCSLPNGCSQIGVGAIQQMLCSNQQVLAGDMGSGENLDLADQVTRAALEVLFKLSASPVHLQACRPEMLMAAVAAQLQHGRQAPAVSRSIQLLQSCSQEAPLMQACAQSGCVQQLLARAQGSDYVAAIASYTLGALVQLAPIRGALLKGQGVRPLVHCLRDADAVLPGPLYLLSCLAELHDTRSHMLQAGLLSALVQLVNRTHDERVHASATSLLRLLTHSKDRPSTDRLP